jgi:hypothetical protein
MSKLTNDKIKDDYFDWLYDYVCKGRAHSNTSYRKIFIFLHQTEFTFSIRNDVNRARDGIDLRYRYAMEIDDESVLPILDEPCSVLEMMVALAVRCEESIMDNTGYGNRTGQWFWEMMYNLGIGNMFDERYNERIAEHLINRFLNREYSAEGDGGLFYIRNCEYDLRDMEIWTQLCWYLDKFE